MQTCKHCDIVFMRPSGSPIPADCCEGCHKEIEAMKTPLCADGRPCGQQDHPDDDAYCLKCPHEGKAPEYEPAEVAFKPLPKQARYQDSQGYDWIDEFARTATPEEFRGAMKFTVGKYLRRAGKKDALIEEVRKMRDYCQRWEQYEQELEQ